MPTFTHQGARLHYVRYGKGPRVWLAFHGFGQTHRDWADVAEAMGPRHSLLAFDLFYHGGSHWPHRHQPLTKARWNELLAACLAELGIAHYGLLGFSLGGKFALATFEHAPQKVAKLVLVAPDGIGTNRWYSLATYPGWTQRLFRRLMVRPNLFYRTTRTLQRLRLTDAGLVRFAEAQMRNRAQRVQVYRAWTVFRPLQFDLRTLAARLRHHQTNTLVFVGTHDRVIRTDRMADWLQTIQGGRLVSVKARHSQLLPALADHLRTEGRGLLDDAWRSDSATRA